ncbi:MAG: FAD-dependent thymidylate synthase [Candidatus Saccharimonadales bacterium]
MKEGRGIFLVIEGTDGSGKGTQFKLLIERLQKEGYDIATFDFPQYDQPSSYFVKEYLNGNYGTADEVGPYTGSLFYALDRYQAAPAIKQAIKTGKVVIANRFTGSNMAHQGTKFTNDEERKGYFLWLDAMEFRMLGIPRPDISLVLRVPAETAQKLVDKKRDLHEADLEHLQKSVQVYDNLCQLFPKDFKQLDCVRNKELLSVEKIHNLMWETIHPMLPAKNNKKTSATKVEASSKYLKAGKHGTEITSAGTQKLKDIVTNTEGNVYAFTENMSPQTVAAAMARLSRRGDDMRITLLDEFIDAAGKDEALLQRVITAYGDDSVQQLVGQHVVVEGASNLLTKKLEWGRLASYLEQSTRYIYFDQKDKDGNYKYYVPSHFDPKTKKSYIEIMDTIFQQYSKMVHDLTDYIQTHSTVPKKDQDAAWRSATRAQACDAVRPVLPVATKSTVGIFGSGQAVESLIMHLQSDILPEAQQTGDKLLEEVRKVAPVFYERADKPERGGAFVAYRATTAQNVKALANSELTGSYSAEVEPVNLTSVWPRNELDLVPDMLYEHSGLPLQQIESEVNKWPYDKKQNVFNTYMGERLNRRHRPGRALEKAHYSWDIVCDYGIFRDLQRHRMVDDLEWQLLTPRYGYEIPKLVDEALLSDDFEACFDVSLKLYSILQSAGYEDEPQYATLLGHRMRWKVTYNAREAFQLLELRSSPQGHPGYRKLAQLMHEKIAEAHPLLAAAMTFINKGEDAKLTRLAAERYTQFKLDQL